MALLTAQVTDFSEVGVSFVAPDVLGDTFTNTGNEMVLIRTGLTPSIVTITSPVQCNQGFTHDIVLNLEANVDKVIGGLPVNRFNDNMGLAKIVCNPITEVTIAIVRV